MTLTDISIHALRVEGDNYGKLADMILAISIHALRVEGDAFPLPAFYRFHKISIHALRVEGDTKDKNPEAEDRVISIHALRVEGDRKIAFSIYAGGAFLSTPSGWRATHCCREYGIYVSGISIHALRVEGDFR